MPSGALCGILLEMMTKEKENQIFECFNKVFDEYNSKKTTKEYMSAKCKSLHRMLTISNQLKKERQ